MVTITKRTKAVIGSGATAVILVTLFLSGLSGEGTLTYSRPDYATCDLTSCFIDYNITNNYPSPITIDTGDILPTDTKGLITKPKALGRTITAKTEDIYSDVEKSFKCDYTVKATSVSANATYTCVTTKDAKEEVLFNKPYTSYDDKTKTFAYNELEKTGEKEVFETAYVEDTLTLQPNEWRIYRVSFDVPMDTWGKFNTTICFILENKQVCDIDDPYWNTTLRWSRPTYKWALNVTNMSSSVVLPINGTSAVTINGTALWVYAMGNGKLYFNSATDYDFNDNGFGKNLMFQTLGTKSEPTTTYDTNLMLYLPLDEATAATAVDYSGRNLDAALTDAPTVNQTGAVFKAYDFESGNTNYMTITDTYSQLQFESGAQDFSVCFWATQEDYTTATAGYPVDYRDASADGWLVQYSTTNDYYRLYIDSIEIPTAANSIADNNFHHICFAIDRDGNGQGYVDGSASGAAAAIGGEAMSITTTNFLIGKRPFATVAYFDGLLDDLQIWSRILTTDEILAIYNAGTSTMTTNTCPTETWNTNGDYDHRRVVDLSDTLMLPLNTTTTETIDGTALMMYGKGDQDEFDYLYYNTSAVKAIQNQTSIGTGLEWFSTDPFNIGTTTYAAATDPVGHWTLDEDAANGSAYDSSGNTHTGTVTGTTQGQTGANAKIYQALSCDGANDYITITDHANFNMSTNDFTISAWANPTATDALYPLIEKAVAGITGWTLRQENTGTGKWQFCTASADAAWLCAISNAAPTAAWTHVLGVRTSGVDKLYVNGILQTTTAADAGNLNAAASVYIGTNYDGSQDYNGKLDDLRIYPRTLSEDEIRQLYTLHGSIGEEENDTVVAVPALTWNWTLNQSANYPTELNITVSSDSAFDVCLLEINSTTNVTMLEVNDTYTYYNYTPAVGNHTYTAYCNNSAGWGQTYEAWYNITSFYANCTSPISALTNINCKINLNEVYDITAASGVYINLSLPASGTLTELFWTRLYTTSAQTLNVSFSYTNTSLLNVTLNLTRTGSLRDIQIQLPLNNTIDCSYDTDAALTFEVTNYENCIFKILAPTSADQVISLWQSPKWTYNNLTPFILAIIAAGGSFYILHKRKTKKTSG